MDSKKNRCFTVHLIGKAGDYQFALVKANSITEDNSSIIFYDSDGNVTGKFMKCAVLGYATRDLED